MDRFGGDLDVLDVAQALEVIGARDRPFALAAQPTHASRFRRGVGVSRVVDPAELAIFHGCHATRLAVRAHALTAPSHYLNVVANHRIRAYGITFDYLC